MTIHADNDLCANCGKAYMEHAANGDWCEAKNEDRQWSTTMKFTPATTVPTTTADSLQRSVDAACAEIDRLRALNAEMLEALECLPLESFGDDMSKCDAADFVDHSGAFFASMVLAKAVIKKAKGRQ